MKKIVVTGATGFIGNYVIAQLLQDKNCNIIASSASLENATKSSWFSSVQYVSFDLKSFDSKVNYYKYFGKPDAIIHLAWEGLPNYKAAFHVNENLPRHFSFLSNCIEHGLTDVTVTGTCFEYGMQEGCLNEEMDTIPANPYAQAKDELRKKLEQLKETENFHLKWVRLFYMFGKGQSPNSLLSQLDRALLNGDAIFNMSGGEQQRDYLPVEKVAEYIVAIALQNNLNGIINCCSGFPVTVKKFVEKYLEKIGQHIQLNLGYYPYADYEPMHFWGDNKKLKTIIDNE